MLDPHSALPVVEERYMAATALLATRSYGFAGDSAEQHEAASALLRCMVSVPLGWWVGV